MFVRVNKIGAYEYLDLADNLALHPLGFGQGEPASRQRRAGERPALRRQQILGEPHIMGA